MGIYLFTVMYSMTLICIVFHYSIHYGITLYNMTLLCPITLDSSVVDYIEFDAVAISINFIVCFYRRGTTHLIGQQNLSVLSQRLDQQIPHVLIQSLDLSVPVHPCTDTMINKIEPDL